jgi:hypothetical protein
MMPNDGIEDHEPSPRQTEEPETLGSHSVERNQLPPVRSLNGEVRKLLEMAFAEGPHGAVWEGLWEKGGGEKDSAEGVGEVGDKWVDGGIAGVERVRLDLTTSIPLIYPPCQVALKDYEPWENSRSNRMRRV